MARNCQPSTGRGLEVAVKSQKKRVGTDSKTQEAIRYKEAT
jgi:hypothetical protein